MEANCLERIEQLKQSIRLKWETIDKVRELNASPDVLVSIRRKIYLEQDEIIALACSNNIQLGRLDLVPTPKNYFCKRD